MRHARSAAHAHDAMARVLPAQQSVDDLGRELLAVLDGDTERLQRQLALAMVLDDAGDRHDGDEDPESDGNHCDAMTGEHAGDL